MAKHKKRRIRHHRGKRFQRKGGTVERFGMLGIGAVAGYGMSNVFAPLIASIAGSYANIASPIGAIAISELLLGSMPSLQEGVTAGALVSLAKQLAVLTKVQPLIDFLKGDGDLPVVTEAEFARIVDQASKAKMMHGIGNPTLHGGIMNPTLSGINNPTLRGYDTGDNFSIVGSGMKSGYYSD